MDFSIDKTAFSEALSLVSSIVPERSARAVLQNLMLSGNADGTITLAATDLEIGLKITVDARGMRDPSPVLLPASRLTAVVKGVLGDDLSVSVADGRAELKTSHGKFQLPGAEVADYPAVPDFKPAGAVFIHGDDFVEAVQKTIFAIAKGDSRYALNGIYVNVQEHGAEFVASDTHRLSLVKKKVRNPEASAFDGIILAKGMSILSRLAAGKDVVEINITANELLARVPNATLVVRRVEGMFPKYNDVIPAKNDNKFSVNRDGLLRSLHSIGLMASDDTKAVLFSISAGAVGISASSEYGAGDIRLDAEVAGAEADIKFNYVFMIDALKSLGDESVAFQYQDADNPARLDSGDFMYVIMPINR